MIENRLPLAIGASILVNLAIWAAVGSAFAARPVAPPPIPIEISRVVIHSDGKKVVKVVKPEEVKKKVERIVKEHHLTPPPPKPKERVPEPPKPVSHSEPRRTEPTPPKHTAPPRPQGAHNRVITAKAASAPKPQQFTALAGGNTAPGKPTAVQAPGTAATNPAEPPRVAPPPAVETKPESKSTAPPPADPGPKTESKAVAPPSQPATPPPAPEKPKKKGASHDAQHSNEVEPSIPDEVKGQEFKKFVRVRVDIAADGSFQVVLRTSSGNDEVDKRVLEALKRWKWTPKLVDGEPVDSTQLFKFEFEVK